MSDRKLIFNNKMAVLIQAKSVSVIHPSIGWFEVSHALIKLNGRAFARLRACKCSPLDDRLCELALCVGVLIVHQRDLAAHLARPFVRGRGGCKECKSNHHRMGGKPTVIQMMMMMVEVMKTDWARTRRQMMLARIPLPNGLNQHG